MSVPRQAAAMIAVWAVVLLRPVLALSQGTMRAYMSGQRPVTLMSSHSSNQSSNWNGPQESLLAVEICVIALASQSSACHQLDMSWPRTTQPSGEEDSNIIGTYLLQMQETVGGPNPCLARMGPDAAALTGYLWLQDIWASGHSARRQQRSTL